MEGTRKRRRVEGEEGAEEEAVVSNEIIHQQSLLRDGCNEAGAELSAAPSINTGAVPLASSVSAPLVLPETAAVGENTEAASPATKTPYLALAEAGKQFMSQFPVQKGPTGHYRHIPCEFENCEGVKFNVALTQARRVFYKHQREQHASKADAYITAVRNSDYCHPELRRTTAETRKREPGICRDCNDFMNNKCAKCNRTMCDQPNSDSPLECWIGKPAGSAWATVCQRNGQQLDAGGHSVQDTVLLDITAAGDCGVLAVCTPVFKLMGEPDSSTILLLRRLMMEVVAQQITEVSYSAMSSAPGKDRMVTLDERERAAHFDLMLGAQHCRLEHVAALLLRQIGTLHRYVSITQMGALACHLQHNLVVYVAHETDRSRRVVLDLTAVLGNRAAFFVSEDAPTIRVLWHKVKDTTDGNWQVWGRSASAHFSVIEMNSGSSESSGGGSCVDTAVQGVATTSDIRDSINKALAQLGVNIDVHTTVTSSNADRNSSTSSYMGNSGWSASSGAEGSSSSSTSNSSSSGSRGSSSSSSTAGTDNSRGNGSSRSSGGSDSSSTTGTGGSSTAGIGDDGVGHATCNAGNNGYDNSSNSSATGHTAAGSAVGDDGVSSAPIHEWHLDHPSITALLPLAQTISLLACDTVKDISPRNADVFTQMLTKITQLLLAAGRRSVGQQRDQQIHAGSLFRHLLPGLLLSPDHRVSRVERFRRVSSLDLEELVNMLMEFTAKKPVNNPATAKTDQALRQRAARLCRVPGGIRKATAELTATFTPVQHTEAVLEHMHSKHPDESRESKSAAADAARQSALQRIQSGDYTPPAFRREEFEEAVMVVIKRTNYHTAPGPDGLRYSHLQLALSTAHAPALVRVLADEVQMLLDIEHTPLPTTFWQLHTAAKLIALDANKYRPLAMGAVLRRLVGATYMSMNKGRTAAAFEEAFQLGVSTSSGCELLAAATQLRHEAGYWTEVTDLSNAYNSTRRVAIFEGLTELAPELVNYMCCTHADVEPQLLFHMKGGSKVVPSRTGSQQGDTFGGINFCAALTTVVNKWNERAESRGNGKTLAYQDDLTTSLQSPLAIGTHHADFLQREAELRDQMGCAVSRPKTVYLAPLNHVVTDSERHYVEQVIGARLVTDGLVLAGIAVGSEAFKKSKVEAIVDTAVDDKQFLRLANHIANMDDKQVALLLARKCLSQRLTHIARTTACDIFIDVIGRSADAINIWLLERIMCLPQTAVVSLQNLLETHSKQATTVLSLHQQLQLSLPPSMGGFGLTSLSTISPAAVVAATGARLTKALGIIGRSTAAEVAAVSACLHDSLLVKDLLGGIRLLLERGVTAEAMATDLPAAWLAAAADAVNGTAMLAANLINNGAQQSVANKCQAKLTKPLQMLKLAAYERAIDALPDNQLATLQGCESKQQAKARHHSLQTKESSAWLDARLTGDGLMLPPEITMACRRNAGIRTVFTTGVHGCPCHGGKYHAADNHHAVTCPLTGLASPLHHDVAYAVTKVLAETNVTGPVTREEKGCFTGPAAIAAPHLEHSMDIVAPIGAVRGAKDVDIRSKQLLIDITVRNPSSHSSIAAQHTDTTPGAAAAKGESDKAVKYTGFYSSVTSHLITAAFETFGRFGTQLKHLLWQLVIHWASGFVCSQQQRSNLMARKLARIREVLSVALQKGLCRRELRYVNYLRQKRVPNVSIVEALWDMSEETFSCLYTKMSQIGVVIGGAVVPVVGSLV